jgi:hypothetical protein
MRRSQERRCSPAVYTAHEAGQIVDQTAPFARLTAQALYPEQLSKRMYVWNPKVTTAAPAYIPTTNIAQRGMGRILYGLPNRATYIQKGPGDLREASTNAAYRTLLSLNKRNSAHHGAGWLTSPVSCA